MAAALPRYATVAFIHYDPDNQVEVPIHTGQEYDLHHPAVEARPDLFTTDQPHKASKKKEA